LEGTGLKFYGWALEDNNNPAKAREFFNAALKIFREIGAKGDVAEVEQTLAKMRG